ncbi:MAG: ribosome-associated toxin RatA of RatAB toxin-antitoxin module [Candidatus Endobugula sp.]|jgi:ribosome-associated toxin RatA of RatAB toxin-antitoxin module
MVTITRSALVEYSARQMYDLINDIEAYPLFMSGCLAAEMIHHTDDTVEARLTLGKSGFQQSFITRNTLIPPEAMVMHLVEGPFKKFDGRWQFDTLSDTACKVSLYLEFEFASPILAITLGSWFERKTNQQVDALCQRADDVYGARC